MSIESTREQEPAPPAGSTPSTQSLLHGTPVAPGLAMGPAHLRELDFDRVHARRVPLDEVEKELNRFQRGLTVAREQLEGLKGRLAGHVPPEQVRILDTHLAYLKDSVFLSDVENLVLGERMCLEGAIAKVILDFDRIFRLVESVVLRERAVDLRDVGIRVLRSLEHATVSVPEPPARGGYVLVARELSIVDMFAPGSGEVRGILTESGSLTSHAAILARSLRIPTLTMVDGLFDEVQEGDFLIVDATEGVVRIRPHELVREQFREAHAERRGPSGGEAVLPASTRDGHPIEISATCGNLPEVERAAELGAAGVGLYRTELLYLVDRRPPTFEALSAHYGAVLDQAQGEVTFRLLDVDSGLELAYLHEEVEPNPDLGLHGVRLLLAKEEVLRCQLAALLVAAGPERRLNVVVPKVVDRGELARVREVLEEERLGLVRRGSEPAREVRVGAVIETPAAALSVSDLAEAADFFVIGLDSLQQYLLAADRENSQLAPFFERLHPVVLRVLRDLVRTCQELERPLAVFGITAASAANAALLFGCGLNRIALAPVAMTAFVGVMGETDLRDAQRLVELAARAHSREELELVVRGG